MNFSVGLPFFRSKYIGWLALESLCRQENIDFEWELIIIEETRDGAMGVEEINTYRERLAAVGCSEMRYIGLDKWVPLGVKLNSLVNEFGDSEVAIWNPNDYYAPPRLLSNAYDGLKNSGAERFCIPKTIFYNIKDEKTIIYDVLHPKSRRIDDSTGRAFRTNLLKASSKYFDQRKSGCDGMVTVAYRNVLGRKPEYYFDKTDNWRGGLNTKGLNNICHWQWRWFAKTVPPFSICDFDLVDTIPPDIIQRLKDCKAFIKNHKRGFPRK